MPKAITAKAIAMYQYWSNNTAKKIRDTAEIA